jgi:hypothetical protein
MLTMSRKKTILCLLIPILLGLWFLLPALMSYRLKQLLADDGFQVTSIGKVKVGFDGTLFSDIKLDKDGNSTIGMIGEPFTLFRPTTFFIRDLDLIGELGPNGIPLIDGWQMKPLEYPKALKSVNLDYARLDLMTPAGVIRIEAKGQLTANVANARRIQAVIYGNQKQLGFDSQWDIKWNADGSWNADGEIGDFRLLLANLEVARASGWLNLRSGSNAALTPVASGQLSAGLLTFSPAALRNASLTVNGSYGALDLILQGLPADPPGLQLTAEAKQTLRETDLDASLTAPNFDGLISFLEKIHTGINTSSQVTGRPLMGLLLTQGNYDRMRKALGTAPYTDYKLTLTGPLGNPEGLVTATGGTAVPKHSVSFDPASAGR